MPAATQPQPSCRPRSGCPGTLVRSRQAHTLQHTRLGRRLVLHYCWNADVLVRQQSTHCCTHILCTCATITARALFTNTVGIKPRRIMPAATDASLSEERILTPRQHRRQQLLHYVHSPIIKLTNLHCGELQPGRTLLCTTSACHPRRVGLHASAQRSAASHCNIRSRPPCHPVTMQRQPAALFNTQPMPLQPSKTVAVDKGEA
jgi:hypothetical protein